MGKSIKLYTKLDGIVIWYSKTIGAWSTSLPWWDATKDFMGASSNNPNSSGNPSWGSGNFNPFG